MKIDTDLRLAIKSAERAQPSNDWEVRQKQEAACIAEFFRTHPAALRTVRKLLDDARKAKAAEDAARKKLCEKFGLRSSVLGSTQVEFANCGDGRETFAKIGGKLPPIQQRRWTFDEAMKELAAADPKELTKILKKYGINWK